MIFFSMTALRSNWSTLMILLISIVGASGGIVAGTIEDGLVTKQQNLNAQERDISYMIDEIERILDKEEQTLIRAQTQFDSAWIEAWRLSKIRVNLTPTEITGILDVIDSYLVLGQNTLFKSLSDQLDTNFTINLDDSVDLGIKVPIEVTLDDFNTFNGLSTLFSVDLSVYLEALNFPSTEIPNIVNTWTIHSSDVIWISDFDVLTDLLNLPLERSYDSLQEAQNELLQFENTSSNLDRAVTIVTVATILSAAMVARLQEKDMEAQFSDVKHTIDSNLKVKKGGDRFAAIILPFAVFISILGIIFAFT